MGSTTHEVFIYNGMESMQAQELKSLSSYFQRYFGNHVSQTLFIQARLICDKVFARYPEFLENGELSSFEVLSDPKFCGKMKVVDKLLKAFQEEKAKVLLFSRSTQVRLELHSAL